jgi:hypothetical protein
MLNVVKHLGRNNMKPLLLWGQSHTDTKGKLLKTILLMDWNYQSSSVLLMSEETSSLFRIRHLARDLRPTDDH